MTVTEEQLEKLQLIADSHTCDGEPQDSETLVQSINKLNQSVDDEIKATEEEIQRLLSTIESSFDAHT